MFFLSKVHVVAVIVATWGCALFGGQGLPYFPIEISRAAASNPKAHAVFTWGILSLLPTLLYESYVDAGQRILGNPLLLWPAVLTLAYFDDQRHMALHVVAVCVLILLVLSFVLYSEDTHHRLPVFLCALAVFGLSATMKGFVVVYIEMQQSLFDWSVPWQVLTNRNGRMTLAIRHVFEIMYDAHAKEWHHVLPIFQVTGVLQWLGFYLLSSIY